MNFIIKYLNFLIKFLKKNLLISLFVIFLLIFGFFQLSIGNFTSSDFTLTNTELVNGNIQLSSYISPLSSTVINNPTLSGYYIYWHTLSAVQYCLQTGHSGLDSLNSAIQLNYVNLYTFNGNSWYFTNAYGTYRVSSLTCSNSVSLFNITGNLVQTNPTTTIEQYDTLTLEYNETLNGGTITPILIVNGVEQSLINNVLTGSFPVGTNVSVKFTFSGSTSATPQLNNNIVLSGSYSAPVVVTTSGNSNLNTASISKKNVLSILSAVPLKSQVQTIQTTNKFKDFISSFFNSIWGVLGV